MNSEMYIEKTCFVYFKISKYVVKAFKLSERAYGTEMSNVKLLKRFYNGWVLFTQMLKLKNIMSQFCYRQNIINYIIH